tara:strand:+ start:394 stop:735 length:342 start_codon:yes stop_codon:yes gene_type:complete
MVPFLAKHYAMVWVPATQGALNKIVANTVAEMGNAFNLAMGMRTVLRILYATELPIREFVRTKSSTELCVAEGTSVLQDIVWMEFVAKARARENAEDAGNQRQGDQMANVRIC